MGSSYTHVEPLTPGHGMNRLSRPHALHGCDQTGPRDIVTANKLELLRCVLPWSKRECMDVTFLFLGVDFIHWLLH
jgi:hypothetical protein